MEAIVPYLNFNGNAREALDLYIRALNGQVEFLQTYGESPLDSPENWKDKVMHATFRSGDLVFMVSDVMSAEQKVNTGSNMSLSLNFRTEAEMEKVFTALSENASITMPLEKTFWGAKFGMLTDRFGINWMFNYDYEQAEK